tara:strand:- start:214 stop:423 length:210 start_codon:yes stop_codon:yes gene_type:complete
MAKDNKYNDLSLEELFKELDEKKGALFNMRFQKSLQQLDHPTVIRKTKKDIARINTRITFLKKQSQNEE